MVNGIKVLELAAEGDDRVDIEGDVELEIKPLKQHVRSVDLMEIYPLQTNFSVDNVFVLMFLFITSRKF